MNNKEEIESKINEMEQKVLKDMEIILKRHNFNMTTFLAHIIASICDIDVTEIFSVNNKAYLSQSRWMFWYAYRYMTGETYERIAEKTSFEGHKFHVQAIIHGITSFAKLLEYDRSWGDKWKMVKEFIKIKNGMGQGKDEKHEVVITVPKNVEVKIKKQ